MCVSVCVCVCDARVCAFVRVCACVARCTIPRHGTHKKAHHDLHHTQRAHQTKEAAHEGEQVAREDEAAQDSYTGTFDNGHPLKGPSLVNMWSDPNPPPAAVTPHDWEAVRDELYRKGKSLGGPKGSVGNLVFRASMTMHLFLKVEERSDMTLN